MKTQFGQELLEKLTSKFILELANFLSDNKINWINVRSVDVRPVDALNEVTIINFKDYQNQNYKLIVGHAKDMSCSNWDMSMPK
jgi:hypothetical protein